MTKPSIKYLRQEYLRAIRIANKDERVKALEREVELLKGNLAETNKRLEALIKYLKVEFVYQKEKYKSCQQKQLKPESKRAKI